MTDSAKPAFLLVTARVTDRDRMAAYDKALTESGLYEAHGAERVFDGQPANAAEGWPAGIGALCVRFPTRAAAEAFWFSAKYQSDIKPLRRGAGTLQAAIFDAA